jgi:hypothetical protein
VNGVPQLQYPRTFSSCNGYGTIPCPLPDDREFELHTALHYASVGKKAAVRGITPLVQVVRLKHGNLKTTGSTSCVAQFSTVNRILPNLPEACRVVCITRKKTQGNVDVTLKVYQFERRKILRILQLLQSVEHEANDFQISEENLNRWPEQGNLAGNIVLSFTTKPVTATMQRHPLTLIVLQMETTRDLHH